MNEILLLPIFQSIKKNIHSGILIDQCWDLPKALVLSYLFDHHEGDMVIITSGEAGNTLFEDLTFFQKNILDLPSWETSGKNGEKPSKDVMGERLNILKKCQILKKKIVFTSLPSFFQKILSEIMVEGSKIELSIGKDISFDKLPEILSSLGMHRTSTVNDKEEFSIRGSIIDIYPSQEKEPVRIEFFGDTIESIRTFDPNSQMSTGKIDDITIGISDEYTLLEKDEDKRSLLSIFNNPIIVFDEITDLEDKAAMLDLMAPLKKAACDKFPHIFFTRENVMDISQEAILSKSDHLNMIDFDIFSTKKQMAFFSLPFSQVKHYDFDQAISLINKGYTFTLVAEQEKEQNILYESLFGKDKRKNVFYKQGYLSSGLVFEEKKTNYLSIYSAYK